MTRHQMIKKLVTIIKSNSRLVNEGDPKLKNIYLDIMYLAKCMRYIESNTPRIGSEIEVEV